MMNDKSLAEPDFTAVMIPYFAELIVADIPDHVRELRFDAMKRVHNCLSYYEERGYIPELLCAIAKKKCGYIMAATAKADMERIIKPRCPQYDGSRFIPDKYGIPEEEIICWNETSLEAPLNEVGFKRYMELFMQMFPEEGRLLPV